MNAVLATAIAIFGLGYSAALLAIPTVRLEPGSTISRDGGQFSSPVQVDLARIRDSRTGVVVEVEVPEIGIVAFTRDRMEALDSGNIWWSGQSDEVGAPYRLNLVISADRAVGLASIPGGHLRVDAPPKSGHPHVMTWSTHPTSLVHEDSETLAQMRALRSAINDLQASPKKAITETELNAEFARALASGETAYIDVLFAYTSAVERRYGGGLQNMVDLVVSTINAGLRNGGVRIAIRSAGTISVTNNVTFPSLGHFSTAAHVGLTGFGFNAESYIFEGLKGARNAASADLVVILGEPGADWPYCPRGEQCSLGSAGLLSKGSLLSGAAGEAVILATVDATDTYTTTVMHEIGHLLGAGHDVRSDPGADGLFSYSRGHRFGDALARPSGTVMTYAAYPQLLFSTPIRPPTCGTSSCGIADLSDNARTLNQSRFLVADYRKSSQVSSVNLTGLWWVPNGAESGWGINLNHQGDILFGTLFSYDQGGAPMWLVMSSGTRVASSTFSGSLYRASGAAFNANPFPPISAANLTLVGDMTITFSGSETASLSYTVNGVTVAKTIKRQVYGTRAARCAWATGNRASLTNYQDLWWNPAESGWGVNVTHQDNTLFATLFTYDASGRDLWLVMSAGVLQPDGSFSGTLYRTSGPPFNANPFPPIGPENIAVAGTMSLRFFDGNTGVLSYSYGGVSVTKQITRQVFSSPVPACS